jgi:hypothetical protein
VRLISTTGVGASRYSSDVGGETERYQTPDLFHEPLDYSRD